MQQRRKKTCEKTQYDPSNKKGTDLDKIIKMRMKQTQANVVR